MTFAVKRICLNWSVFLCAIVFICLLNNIRYTQERISFKAFKRFWSAPLQSSTCAFKGNSFEELNNNIKLVNFKYMSMAILFTVDISALYLFSFLQGSVNRTIYQNVYLAPHFFPAPLFQMTNIWRKYLITFTFIVYLTTWVMNNHSHNKIQ